MLTRLQKKSSRRSILDEEEKTMKFLMERREIAEAINIKKYPVLTMDISRPLHGDEFYKDSYGDAKMVVAAPSRNYPDAEERIPRSWPMPPS